MKKTITTIEMTDTGIRLLQARELEGRKIITFCNDYTFLSNSDKDVVDTLKEAVAALPVSTKDIILLIPRRQMILKHMTIAPGSDHEINDMIGLQLVNKLPFPIEDMVYRYQIIDQDGKGNNKVLVMLLQRSAGLRYCRLLQKAGIKDVKLILDSIGICQWADYQQKAGADADVGSMALLNIDAQYSQICSCVKGQLRFSRSIPYGEDHLFVDEAGELIKQVKLSLGAYKEEGMGPAPQKMVVISSSQQGRLIAEQLKRELRVPLEAKAPLHNVFCAQSMDKTILRQCHPSSLTPAIGFLLSDTRHDINLAPEEIHTEKHKKAVKFKQIKLAFIFLAAMTSVVVWQTFDIRGKQLSLKLLDAEIERQQPRLEEAEQRRQLVKFFDSKLSARYFIPDLINALALMMPESVSLRSLSLDKQRELTVQGYASTQKDVADLQAQLVQSKKFHGVDLKFATKRKIANKQVTDFKITAEFGIEEGADDPQVE